MTAVTVKLTVNGREIELSLEPHERLVDVLRGRLGLTGTKMGCGEGECGACTVIMDGQAVLSCLMLAVQAEGSDILTIEGLAPDGSEAGLHPLQKAFVAEAAIQCGYCTPGMILTAKTLLECDSDPTPQAVKEAIAGNICRCTGYDKPVKAILAAAAEMKTAAQGTTAATVTAAAIGAPEAAAVPGNVSTTTGAERGES